MGGGATDNRKKIRRRGKAAQICNFLFTLAVNKTSKTRNLGHSPVFGFQR